MDETGHDGTPTRQPELQLPEAEGFVVRAPEVAAPAPGASGTAIGAPALAGQAPPTRPADTEADLVVLGEAAAELDGIEAALARIDKGSYGQCATCGAPLEAAALEADPLLTACPAHR